MERLEGLYAAFNARDVNAVLAATTPDVDWPNAWEGGRVVGQEAVRDYWTRQWAQIAPTVTPVRTTPLPDGRVTVEVMQEVRALDGTLLRQGRARHVYTFRDGLVARMDVEA
jgi:nuclear transport factor 2 (NTF2) superfamily protein